jgi:plasmid stabilization system protein ParE
MKRFLLTRSAKKDIDEIWLYIVQKSDSVTPAERFISRLHTTIVTLAANPGIGRRSEEIDRRGRCFPAGDYIVYYREESSRIAITHVFHSKRDQRKAWQETQSGKPSR